MSYEKHVENLPYVHGGTAGSGLLKASFEDFIVNETLSFEPSGEGEHAFLYIQKTGLNTDEVLKKLAIHANVPRRTVSYAGMKDRQAVTKQWFSVQLPGKEDPDWSLLNDEFIHIEYVTRHIRKLKRGAIKFNAFEITVSDLDVDKSLVEERAEHIKRFGVPNYFMQQRFGYLAQNLSRAEAIFSRNEKIKDRKLKSLFLSSVRSFLFNEVLAKRVERGTWDKAETGDAFMLDGTRQFFKEDSVSNEISQRLDEHDVHPAGLLFGKGESIVSDDAEAIEQAVFEENKVFCQALIRFELEQARRAFRLVPNDFILEWLEGNKLKLKFNLPSGSYATAVVRELIKTKG